MSSLPPPPPPRRNANLPPPPHRNADLPPVPTHQPAARARAPMGRNAKLAIIAGVVIALGGLISAGILRQRALSPSDSLVRSFLSQEVGEGGLVFDQIDRTERQLNASTLQLDITAKATSQEPLYSTIDTADFLVTALTINQGAVREAKTLMDAKNAARLRELAKLETIPTDPLTIPVVRETAPRGASGEFHGILTAYRADGEWVFTLNGGNWITGAPEGKPRKSLLSGTIVSGSQADEQRLRSAVESYLECAAKLQAASKQFEAELAKERQAKINEFLTRLAPGSLYRGTAVRRNDGRTTPLYLEIVETKADSRRVSARLRNDGGWSDARRFQGEWKANTDTEAFTLTLTTGPRDAIRDAGVFLQDSDGYSIVFDCGKDGALTGQSHSFDYRFMLVPADEVEMARAELVGDFTQLMNATKVGSTFLGAAISKKNDSSERVLLRFTRQENDGALIQAVLRSPDRASWTRELNGTLISNRYRSEGRPLRLVMASESARKSAREDSVFRATRRDGLQLNLMLEGSSLVGEDDMFHYKLAPAEAEQIAIIDREQSARERRFTEIVQAGAAYDGVARDTQGFSTRVRLRIKRVEAGSNTLQVVFESLQQGGIFHAMSGSFDIDAGTIGLGSSGEGKFNPSGYLRLPIFSRDAVFKASLELGEKDLKGVLVDQWNSQTDWSFAFPLLQQGEAPVATSQAPTFPRQTGAYVWIDGQWVALPRNNGKVVQSAGTVLGSLLTGLSDPKQQNGPQKLAEIVYDGRETPPEVSGESLVIAFVGTILPNDPTMLEQYPELAGFPDLEIARSKTASDSKRRVDLVRLVPGIAGFGPARLAATVEKLEDGVLLLTATSRVPAGRYAVAVSAVDENQRAFEIRVK